MGFSALLGQDTAKATLEGALRAGKVHHAYRFEGQDGVGKEKAAFALAQALVCTGGDALGCERCDACRRAVTFASERPESPLHPDVSVIERNFYPPEVIGRSRPELAEISVDQVRKIVLSHSAFAPHEGRARVFIVRRADELSISAGNAFLKTLEEPRPNTHFVLLTSRGDKLINTIRSRTLPVRFAPLSSAVMRTILKAHAIAEERHDTLVDLAEGSAARALELADDERSQARDAFVERVFRAIEAKDLGAAIAFSEGQDGDKDMLRGDLAALGAALARSARKALVAGDPRAAKLAAERYDGVVKAAVNVDKNASPGLTLIALVRALRAAVAS